MVRNRQIPAQNQTLIFQYCFMACAILPLTGVLFVASRHQEWTLQFTKAHSGLVDDKETATDYIEHTWVVI